MTNHELLTNLIAEYTRYIDSREGYEITEQGFLNFYGTTIKDKEFPAPELQEAEDIGVTTTPVVSFDL